MFISCDIPFIYIIIYKDYIRDKDMYISYMVIFLYNTMIPFFSLTYDISFVFFG